MQKRHHVEPRHSCNDVGRIRGVTGQAVKNKGGDICWRYSCLIECLGGYVVSPSSHPHHHFRSQVGEEDGGFKTEVQQSHFLEYPPFCSGLSRAASHEAHCFAGQIDCVLMPSPERQGRHASLSPKICRLRAKDVADVDEGIVST